MKQNRRIYKFILLTIFGIAIFITSLGPPMLPHLNMPGQQQASEPGEWCTQVGYPITGFPFKTDLYDSCGQDPSIKTWIAVVNFLILTFVVYAIYRLVKFLRKSIAKAKN